MNSYKLLTYKNQEPQDYQFYILTKGTNAGRPMFLPCPNCVIVTVSDADYYEYHYQIAVMAFKARAYYPLHKGSVIPFIRINDVRQVLDHHLSSALRNPRAYQQVATKLSQLDKLIAHNTDQLQLLKELHSATAQCIMKL